MKIGDRYMFESGFYFDCYINTVEPLTVIVEKGTKSEKIISLFSDDNIKPFELNGGFITSPHDRDATGRQLGNGIEHREKYRIK